MTQIFKNQPQRVPIGSFMSPQGAEVQVFITQPWFRAFEALSKVDVTSGGGGSGTVTFDDIPPFEYGDIVFASSASSLQRLPGVASGDVLYDGGPGSAPSWGPPPNPLPAVLAGNIFYDGGPGNPPISAPLPLPLTPRQVTQYVALRAF